MAHNDPKAEQHIFHELRGTNNDLLGHIAAVYVDDASGREKWFAVRTGLFGEHMTFVPTVGAIETDGAIAVPYSKSTIKSAPHTEPDQDLSTEDEARLNKYYGITTD